MIKRTALILWLILIFLLLAGVNVIDIVDGGYRFKGLFYYGLATFVLALILEAVNIYIRRK